MEKTHHLIDHIFGDLDLPENSAPYSIKHLRGVHHDHMRVPAFPMPGQTLELTATTSDEKSYTDVELVYSCDDWKTTSRLPFKRGRLAWNTLIWGRVQHWHARLPAQKEGTVVRYRIGAQVEGTTQQVFADNQAGDMESGTHFSLLFSARSTPGWAKEAVVYQVFVDRFSPGMGDPWLQTENLSRRMGGTLRGVIEKLDDIRGMGFNTLWLSPIFASPSHHGYDVQDYENIDPHFGTMADFEKLLDKAHQVGIRVLLDLVANHCSNEHPFFQSALQDEKSEYHDWFVWDGWPKYRCFYDVREMPEFDLRFGRPARAYLLEVAKFWLQKGVDGFRLDYAHGPEQDFWTDFRVACQAINPQAWTFGEIVQPADRQLSFAGSLDGSLDFLLCQALRYTFAQKIWPVSRFVGFLKDHFQYYAPAFSLPAFIDNHDMNRFLFAAGEDLRSLKLGLTLLYLLPNPPVIYYGTEVGLSQMRSIHSDQSQGFDEARLPMRWDGQDDGGLVSLIRNLASVRKDFYLTADGAFNVLHVDDEQETFVLGDGTGVHWICVNRSNESRLVRFEVRGGGVLTDLLTGEDTPLTGDEYGGTVDAMGVRLLRKKKG